MEYKMKCLARHGICYNGGVREYEGEIQVDLDPSEIQSLESEFQKEQSTDLSDELEKHLPLIYNKIKTAAHDFLLYSWIFDLRITGKWEEGNESVKESDLLAADIQSGEFKPLYTNCKSNPDALIETAWMLWEADKLAQLPYKERTAYYAKRYQIELADDDDCFDFSFKLNK